MKMKKTISFLMVLLMLLPAVIGCTNTGNETTTPASETTATPTTQTPTEASTTETPVAPTSTETPTTETPTTETPVSPTPTETPTTETPVVTPTPEPDGRGKTEEELGVLPVGQYTITLAGSTQKLGYPDTTCAGDVNLPSAIDGALDTVTIVFQTYKNNPYYLVFAGDDYLHVLASPYKDGYSERSVINDGEEVVFRGKKYMSGSNAYYDDKFEPMQWQFIENEDGTYRIKSNKAGAELYLAFVDGKVIAASEDKLGEIQSFNLEMKERGAGNAFLQYISDEGNVTVRISREIKKLSKMTDEEFQEWANQLDDAYLSYCELTDYVTHDNLIVKSYEPAYVPGYVWNDTSHYNVITLNEVFMRGDLQKKKQRIRAGDIDWNFCALHEMGHMFDNQQPWDFEAEMMTDLKIAYVLEKNGVGAAPSEYAYKQCFYADRQEDHLQIEECYIGLSNGKVGISESLVYSPYGAALKFVEIQRLIDDENWTCYKQVYKELHAEGKPGYWNSSIAFRLFVDKIAEVSGKNVRALFTDMEWNVYLIRVYDSKAVYFNVKTDSTTERKPTTSMSIKEGETSRTGVVCNAGGLTYVSSNPEVATVSEDGVITAVAKGSAEITITQAEDGGVATLKVTVTK